MTIQRSATGANFDSVFEPAQPGRAAKLNIQLKVTLLPFDPKAFKLPPLLPEDFARSRMTHLAWTDAEVRHGLAYVPMSRPVPCKSWLVPAWEAFKVRFKKMVELSWNNQMLLLPVDGGGNQLSDADYRQLIGNPKLQAHVQLGLAIEIMPGEREGNAVLSVANLEDASPYLPENMTMISNRSVEFLKTTDVDFPEWSTQQIPAAHEIGHWLRSANGKDLDHIDLKYALKHGTGFFDIKAYGRNLSRKAALMGGGNLFTAYEAGPWLERIKQHIPAQQGWTPIHRIDFGKIMSDLSDRQKRLLATP